MRHKISTLLLAVLMSLPAMAMPAAAQEPDMDAFYAERLAELDAYWASPSTLSVDEAAALLDQAAQQLPMDPDDALQLAKFLRDTEGTSFATEAAREWIAATLARGLYQTDAWQQNTWDAYGAALTLAWLAGGAVNDELLPHNLRIPGIYVELDIASGCNGGWRSGTCYVRLIADLMALAALDMHYTTDTLAAQLPLAIEVHLHWRCSWGCYFWVEVHILNILVAQNAEYVFAFPAMSGEFASRVTDMDILQSVYDRLGGLNYQKPREITSAAIGTGTPVPGAVPGGTPGVGDLHAVAPAPNYYGLQVPPEVNRPGLPGAAPAQAHGLYAQVHTRVRDNFGTVPVDSLGPTVGFQMSHIYAWRLNVAIVRWKNLGADVATLPEPPATFYYDTGSYFDGGGPNQWTRDYSIRESLL